MFSLNRIENLLDIENQLLNNKYKFGPYKTFMLYDNKRRFIVSSPFKDRIVHWILYRYLEKIYNKKFISDSFGNITGKGTLKGVQRAKKMIQKQNTKYVLKIDFSKYFYSIHHSVLKNILSKKVKDEFILSILSSLIDSYKTGGIFDYIFPQESVYFETPNKGIPIGSLTSQIFANIYLNELDHYVKDYLQIKNYIRYVDDIVIFAQNKKELWDIYNKIESYCNQRLKLIINPRKVAIFPINKGLDFLGYRIFKYKTLPRKRTQTKIRRAIKFNDKSILTSYNGILLYSDSYLKKLILFHIY